MSLAEALAGLPDDARCYVPGVGEVTVLELVRARAPEETAALAWERKVTVEMWEALATLNLSRECQDGATPSDVRAYHVSRFLNGLTQLRSS